MDLSNDIYMGFDFLASTKAVIGNKEVLGVFNNSNHRDNKTLGGYEADDELYFVAKTNSLENPRNLKGAKITINSDDYRIVSVSYGEYLTRLQCQSVNKS